MIAQGFARPLARPLPWTSRRKRICLVRYVVGQLPALIALFVASPASGQQSGGPPADTVSLTLVEARGLAMRANPELRAARFDVGIARGRLRQAGVLAPNPSADVLAGGEGAEVGLTQEIEIGGQRGARRAAARAGVDRAAGDVRNVARLTIGEVDRAFYNLVAASRRSALADEVFALNERLADVAQRQLAAGGISRLEYNLATVEFGRSRARGLAARREYDASASELRQLLVLPPNAPIVPVTNEAPPPAADSLIVAAHPAAASSGGDRHYPARTTGPLDLDSLTAIALARRPDLAAREAGVREATAEISVARREGFPNLAARASSERTEEGDRELRPGVGITLPFFNRNRGEVESRRAEAAQALVEREAVTVRIRAEVARAAAAYTSAAAEAEVLETTVLTPARENRRLLEIAYREGKVGLPVLLLIRNQVIDAELEYWEAWLAQRVARADLAAATAETVVDYDPAAPERPGGSRDE